MIYLQDLNKFKISSVYYVSEFANLQNNNLKKTWKNSKSIKKLFNMILNLQIQNNLQPQKFMNTQFS